MQREMQEMPAGIAGTCRARQRCWHRAGGRRGEKLLGREPWGEDVPPGAGGAAADPRSGDAVHAALPCKVLPSCSLPVLSALLELLFFLSSLKMSTTAWRELVPIPSQGAAVSINLGTSRIWGYTVVVCTFLRALPFTNCFPHLVPYVLLLF